MKTNEKAIDAILNARALPLFYHDDTETCLEVMRSLYKAGIRALEFTNRGFHALTNFEAMLSERDDHMKDMLLGIGTIRNIRDLNDFAEAGADFFVSPVVDVALLHAAHKAGAAFIPGCMTPTEIHVAASHGCSLVKIFPGNIVTQQFIRAIKEIFPGMKYMVTGGVEGNRTNLQSWFNAGAHAVGLGSNLISKELLADGAYDELENETRNVLNILASIQ
jgi:2-dehydro-3-deoxyphosphogluconate aldolase / (4S)-4-hydroxy-2-oxoglutarate aldolase